MTNTLRIGVLGCGDFLRWMSDELRHSSSTRCVSFYDPELARAQKFASDLGGVAVENDDEIFNDPEIDAVMLFVPPWIRRGLIERAIACGKHIVTTKPLAATVEDSAAIVRAVEASDSRCGVIYRRTGEATFETLRDIFESGEIGRLTLFKQDWLHHYPTWNVWATDPARNGGPFMDAMIHNLNIACYLMNRAPTDVTYFSDNHAQNLKCRDTEFMKIDFADNGAAHLFITWAADMEVMSNDGNDREHIDINYMITSEGWHVSVEGSEVVASKDGAKKSWPISPLPQTRFDAFAATVFDNAPLRRDIANAREAFRDIKIIRDAETHLGSRGAVDLSL